MSWKPPRKNSLKTTQREMDSQGTCFCALQGLRGWRRNRNNERGATGETAVLQYSCWPSFGTSTKSPTQVASRKTRTLIKTHSSTKKHVQCVETNKCNGNSHPGFQNTNRFPKSNGAEISSAKGALRRIPCCPPPLTCRAASWQPRIPKGLKLLELPDHQHSDQNWAHGNIFLTHGPQSTEHKITQNLSTRQSCKTDWTPLWNIKNSRLLSHVH